MNAINTPAVNPSIVISVKTMTDQIVSDARRKFFPMEKVASINEVFDLALIQANYAAPTSAFEAPSNLANGTGYYDPLIATRFVDEDNNPVPNGSSIAMLDKTTNRRLYVIVLADCNNIIIHDRYRQSGAKGSVILVATGGAATSLLHMNPAWIDVSSDVVFASKMFGLEYDKRAENVYVPLWRKQNWFKTQAQFLTF